MPKLSSSETIIKATLALNLLAADYRNRQVNVFDVLGDWDSSKITWSNSPYHSYTVTDYQMISGAAGTRFEWDITSIAQRWYSTNNYGLALRDNLELSNGYNRFYPSENNTFRPYAVMYYVNNSGLEDYWSYTSQSAGRAGNGYVNDFNGNLIFTHDDLSMNGSRMPIGITHVYNSNDRDLSLGFGLGWRLNLSQRIKEETISGIKYYVYTDADATKHYFRADSAGPYKDESGLDLTMTKTAIGFTISDSKDNIMTFDLIGSEYMLKTIMDSNSNKLTVNYGGTAVTSVTDGAGRTVSFEHYTDPGYSNYGFIKAIVGPNGKTEFIYTGQRLTKIKYPDGKESNYSYYSDNKLESVTNIDGFKLNYFYYTASPYKVMKISEIGTDGSTGGELNVSYENRTTTYTDQEGRKTTYQFNEYGNTIAVVDNEGRSEYYRYIRDTGKPARNNKVDFQSKLQSTVINLIKNHNVETNTEWGTASTGSSTGSTTITSEDKYLGNQSLKITKTNNLDRHYFAQSVTAERDKTYTFSAFIKTNGITNSKKGGANLFVSYQDGNGRWQTTEGSFINGTNGWQRYEIIFTMPKDAVSTTIWPSLSIANETGTSNKN